MEAERKTIGEFIRPDGVSSGKVEIYVTEIVRGQGIQGLSDTHGWAPGVSWKWAAPILVGDMKCDLVYDGKRIPVLIAGKGDEELTLRFERA
jgi:hypothetical protein